MGKHVLTDEEKDHLKLFVEEEKTAQFGLYIATKNLEIARKKLWEEIHALFPKAVKIENPENGDWSVYTADLDGLLEYKRQLESQLEKTGVE